MADVITRFKLETSSFDSKLRDTAKALQGIAHQAQFAGKDFNAFSQKSIEAARALGTVASGATNTKDKLKDLVGSYNDAAKAYKSLSDAAKKGEFGQALSASLQKLQIDIKQTKEELYGLGDAVSGKGSGLFGENGLTGMMQVFGGNLLTKGVTMLTSELTGAIEESINLAKQGEGIRMAFDRLKQPGLLDKLKDATHGTVSEIELMQQAIKFDNFKLPLEDLANYLAFAQQKAKDTGESIDYLVNSIVTGLGRQSKQILDNLGISASELTRRMNEGADMTKAVSDIIKEEMAKAGDYIETAADRAARATADAKNKMEDLGRSAMPVAEQFSEAWNTIKIGAMSLLNNVLVPIADSIRDIQNILGGGEVWNVKAKPGITNLADDPNVDENGNYKTKNWNSGNMFTWGSVNDISEVVVTGNKPKKKTKSTSSRNTKTEPVYVEGSIAAQAKLVSDLTKKWNEAGEDMRTGYLFQLVEAEKKLKGMKDQQQAVKDMLMNKPAKGISPQGLADSLMPDLKAIEKEFERNPIKLKVEVDTEKVKSIQKMAELQKAASDVATVVGSIGQAFSSIEDPAAKITGTIAQAIATIALGYAQATTQAATLGPWAWVAFAATGMAQMISMIQSIHSATGYAEGGIIKGNSYSGDNIPIMANAGEVVLTKAMTNNLAAGIQSQGMGGWQLKTRLAGTDLLLSVERTLQKQGYGKIATWG